MFFTLIAAIAHPLDCKKMGDLGLEIYTNVNLRGTFRMAVFSNHELFHVSSQMWEAHKNLEEKQINLIKKPKYTVEAAFRDLVKKGGVMDCRLMRGLAMHWSAFFFNQQTQSNFSDPVVISGKSDMYEEISILSFDLAPVGSYVYVPNIKAYNEVHEFGGAIGENLCVVSRNKDGESLFVSYLNAEPRTITDIYVALYRDFMQEINYSNLRKSLKLLYIKMDPQSFAHLVDIKKFDELDFLDKAEQFLPKWFNAFIQKEKARRQEQQDLYRNDFILFFDELMKAQESVHECNNIYLKASVLKKEYMN